MTPIPNRAFTVRATGRVLRLTTPVEIWPPFVGPAPVGVQGRQYQALYDTGATHSTISPKVVQDLTLQSIGATSVGVGGGNLTTTSHLVNITLPNNSMFTMVRVAQVEVPSGEDVIIGMDILGLGDFAVTHFGGKTTFSFCVPSRKDIDFVAEVDAYNKTHPPAKNALCPCKSGKKYKSCHGRRSH
jgi:predicted aspartyl protease